MFRLAYIENNEEKIALAVLPEFIATFVNHGRKMFSIDQHLIVDESGDGDHDEDVDQVS